VLAIQDTTVVRSDGGGGQYLHAVVAVDAEDDAVLGLMHACFMTREEGKKAVRALRPLAEKESRRWLDGASRAAEVGAEASRITVISDREGDIFETFALRPARTDVVVRAAHDRSLDDGGRLFARADALPEAGRARLKLRATSGRKAREAELAVRFMRVELARPRGAGRAELQKSVGVTLVDVREVDPPPGESVHWRLLTSHPVADAGEAFAVADLYRRRWAIEQLFRTLKTQGFDIEGLRIGEDAPRAKLVMAALVAAVTVQQLVHARDGSTGTSPLRPLADAFDPDDRPLLEAFCRRLEGKTERQRTLTPKALSPMPPGSAHGSAGGQATTASQDPSSCCKAGSTSRPPSEPPPSFPSTTMCESASLVGRADSAARPSRGGGRGRRARCRRRGADDTWPETARSSSVPSPPPGSAPPSPPL